MTLPTHSHGYTTTATARVVENLELYGYHPAEGELDLRPLPEPEALDALAAALFETVAEPLTGTGLESDLDDLLWSLTDLFHRKAARASRALDDNEDRQRQAQKLQDGSEIRSVDLERLIVEGQILIEKRNAYEHLRDAAALQFEAATGSAWRPRAGSMVNHKNLTAAMIDSRDFIAAKRLSERDVLVPKGTRVAFAGGPACNDHERIWTMLDKALARYPDMVLLHGGAPRGAEVIAVRWAQSRKVVEIAFKPEWSTDGKAAPFKRNDRLLDTVPSVLIVFPGSGITDNLADKARKLGIRIADCRKPPA